MVELSTADCVRDTALSGRYLRNQYGGKAYFARPGYLSSVPEEGGDKKRMAGEQSPCNPSLLPGQAPAGPAKGSKTAAAF